MNRSPRLSGWTAGTLVVLLLIAAGCFPPTPSPAAPADPNTITGIVWEWTSLTDQSTKQTETVANPQDYTITFNTDGTLAGKADCNTFSGTYAQENGLIMTLGATSMAFCGDASLDQEYLQLLIDKSSKPRTEGVEAVPVEERAPEGLRAQMRRKLVG
jgi:heat shock protein HslJ